MLDIGQYTGERKRRGIKMIPFWKKEGKEDLRKASLIYDPWAPSSQEDEKVQDTDEPTGKSKIEETKQVKKQDQKQQEENQLGLFDQRDK